MTFTVIDVETSNSNRASICQIGIVRYEDGDISYEWSSYVNPQTYFNRINVSIHGINQKTVDNAPDFPTLAEDLFSMLDDSIIVSHGSFDQSAISKTCERYDLRLPTGIWLDSTMVARRVWTELDSKGYRLDKLCKEIGYEFNHHDALADAKAAARVLMAAVDQSGISVKEWLEKVKHPISAFCPALPADCFLETL